MSIDCDQLAGRLRDICRGHDDNGNPVLTPEKCEEYRQYWLAQAKKESPRPGYELKKILRWFGQDPNDKQCKCNARAAIMDREGLDWCEENQELIVGWLMEEWDRRGLSLAEFLPGRAARWLSRLVGRSERELAVIGARWAVKTAIRRARKKSLR